MLGVKQGTQRGREEERRRGRGHGKKMQISVAPTDSLTSSDDVSLGAVDPCDDATYSQVLTVEQEERRRGGEEERRVEAERNPAADSLI
ncbi:hypothetical protein EYF80_006931 [Liparis tanakae]|uniref:Uncharacterized protein n=1 Tax=Liparis tanakae TaxID=230148 RepID=A0A4Z2IZJ0_9TELE|nr:hypothetical protein EYF80_006931 [Liparis tanakae]